VPDDIREELARVICDALDEHMSVPTPGEITKSDYLTADAILASPVIARVRAEAWDQGAQYVLDMYDFEPYRSKNPYRHASIRSGSEEN
jgi:hypothetical protein